ncbi:MAG: hypothetical protein NVSMB2_21560 [Chloroflexota bacterium]
MADPPARVAHFTISTPDGKGDSYYRITRDGESAWQTQRVGQVFAYLLWTITNLALETAKQQYLLFHGGAVSYRGQGIILPAASRSGKTTLTGGLVANGFQYYSDDVVVIEPSSVQLMPFPKSLCIKHGSRAVLGRLYPELLDGGVPRVRFDRECVWYLAPPREALPPHNVPIRFVVLPRYVPGAATSAERIGPPEAARRFFEQSFNLGAHGADGVAALARMLNGSECYSLTVGTLETGVAAVRDLVGAP